MNGTDRRSELKRCEYIVKTLRHLYFKIQNIMETYMEKMTAAEKKLLRELQAKEKRVMRAEAEFLKEADSRKDELLKRWEISDRLEQAAELIGTDSDTLFVWITSDIQVRYFRQKHPQPIHNEEKRDSFVDDSSSA